MQPSRPKACRLSDRGDHAVSVHVLASLLHPSQIGLPPLPSDRATLAGLETQLGAVRPEPSPVLTRFAELVEQNRGVAEAMVTEILVEGRPAGVSPRPAGVSPRPRQIRQAVPLPALLVPHVRELRARGRLRRRIDSESLARSFFYLVAMRTLMSPDDSVERIIDDTVGLLLEGALVAGD